MPRRKNDAPDYEIRDSRVVCYFTPQDAAYLDELAKDIGMSRSALISSVFERLITGGFSVAVFIKIALQLARRFQKSGALKQEGFFFGLRPLPPLPDDGLSEEEIEAAVVEIEQLKKC